METTAPRNICSSDEFVQDPEARPVVHAFGHIHEAARHQEQDGTTSINAAMASGGMTNTSMVRGPVVFVI